MIVTPPLHVLQSFRAERGSWSVLEAEALDNSLDAGATRFTTELSRDRVVLSDNGAGILRHRMEALATIGQHAQLPTTRLGRFGVGIKLQALSAGELFQVVTNSQDGHGELIVRWDAIRVNALGQWETPDPQWRRARARETAGTRLEIARLRWPSPSAKDLERVRHDLALWFHPALYEGVTVIINTDLLAPLRDPDLEQSVAGQVDVRPGKGAQYVAGLIKESSPLYQVHVAYGHRVIEPQGTFGCGLYTGLRRFFARVTLVGDWGLSRFKNEILDSDEPTLRLLLEEAWRHLLEQCEAATMNAVVDSMTERLNAMLPPDLIPVRPERKRPPGPPQPPRPPGPPHRPSVPDGPPGVARRRAAPRNQLLIEFMPELNNEYGYGVFLQGTPSRIQLARDNPHIATWLSMRDQAAGAASLYGIAMMLYVQARQAIQGDLFTPDDPFGLKVWKLVAQQPL